ncbi:MAG: MBL fold metallo-hydrolase [Pseudomonadota bacterium]
MAQASEITALAEGITCVRCNNPSPLTGPGTNTFLVGLAEIAVIDPGPDDPDHLDAILAAVPPDAKVTKVLVTHSHLDHSPNARPLSERTGAPVYAFGPDGSGRSTAMKTLASTVNLGGGEGRDTDFAPNITLADGEDVPQDGALIRAHWTPGHYGNHTAYQWGDVAFSGDLVMGWATTLISPPDGDVSDFIASCERLKSLSLRALHAAHGAPILDPAHRLQELIDHRRAREAEILTGLQAKPLTPADLAAAIYKNTPKHLWPAAQRNVFAHLIDLTHRGLVDSCGTFAANARFTLR